jgi:NAD(P)-dependent dehydrogenase (short-subunit alcohol dehydrogenase family)
MEIDGSVALVTGANRGLGQAYARELVRRGAANVYGGARDPATVTEPGVTPILLDAGRVPPVPQAGNPRGDADDHAVILLWIVVFFFASAGASAGYLTVSEIFPIEIRAEALAVFFAIAQIVGAFGPAFYGVLIGNGTDRTGITIGYLVGGAIMIIGGLVEIAFGIDAEGKPLEEVAAALTEIAS